MNVLFVVKHPQRTYLGVMYVSAALKTEGHQTYVAGADSKTILRSIKDHGVDLSAFSTPTIHFGASVRLARELKKHVKISIVFGGPHLNVFH